MRVIVLTLFLLFNVICQNLYAGGFVGDNPRVSRKENSQLSRKIDKINKKKKFLWFENGLKKSLRKKKLVLESAVGKVFAILLFGIPGLFAYVVGFAYLFGSLKTGSLIYFRGWLWVLIAGVWALLGGFIGGKNENWRKIYSIIFHWIPCVILGVFAIVEMFSIIFGTPADNLILCILTLILGFIIGSLAIWLGGD